MKRIEIDDELYAFLQKRAIAYEETPGLTLRRLLLRNEVQPRRRHAQAMVLQPGRKPALRGRKRRRADLAILVSKGVIRSGDVLELRDYRGRKVDGCEASVAENSLLYQGKRYSMSNLAKMLLKRHGYESKAVRGPLFWFTTAGRSVKELWDEHGE